MDRESILVPGVALPVPLAYAIAEEFLAAPSLLAIGTLIVFAARRSAQAAARFPVAHQGVWGGGCGVLRLSARGLPGGHCSSTAAAHDVVCGWPRPALVVPGVVDGGIGLHALESGVCALCTGLIPSAVIDASAHTPICDPSVRLDRWRWRWRWWWWWRWSCRSGSLWLRLLWWWWWLCGSSWLGGDHGLLLWGGLTGVVGGGGLIMAPFGGTTRTSAQLKNISGVGASEAPLRSMGQGQFPKFLTHHVSEGKLYPWYPLGLHVFAVT